MLALEYSPKDSNVNSTVCVLSNSPALRFTEFKGDSEKVGETEKEDIDSDTVLVYHSRCKFTYCKILMFGGYFYFALFTVYSKIAKI